MIECEGNCHPHKGSLVKVRVYDPIHNADWGEFLYCETAVKSDKDIGLIVTEVKE